MCYFSHIKLSYQFINNLKYNISRGFQTVSWVENYYSSFELNFVCDSIFILTNIDFIL